MAKTLHEDRWIYKVKRFNKTFPPGTPVTYTTPAGIRIKTDIRYPAVVLSNGRPVIWLVNIRNYCSLDRVVVESENT